MSGGGTRTADATPRAKAISNRQVACLAKLVSRPSRYTQRYVEEFSFLPDGGEKRTCTLQVRIPFSNRRSVAQWWPVPVGAFRRKRYPDFSVADCTGRRVTLLTRQQHGRVLAQALLQPYVKALSAATPRERRMNARTVRNAYTTLVSTLSELLTLMPLSKSEAQQRGAQLSGCFRAYAVTLGVPDETSRLIRLYFGLRIASETQDTRYLCWVRAAPGEVVTLTATYTAHDTVRRPLVPRRHRSTKREAPQPCERGSRHRFRSWWTQARLTVGPVAMRIYRQLGLAPLAYASEAPANTAANSYYFTISPPARTIVTALISNVNGSHADDGELDCSSTSFHIHNETEPSHSQSALLRSYLLPERREHILIAAGALLNIWLVYLVSQGRFVNDFSAQTLILLTPTVLTGIIARQQDHYYAPATGYQRALLWLYLFGGAAFVVTVTFSRQGLPGGAAGWGPSAKEILIGFAALSAFIAVIYGLGPSFYRTTKWRTRRLALKEGRKEERKRANAERRRRRSYLAGEVWGLYTQ